MAEFPTRMANLSKSGVVTKTFAPKFCAEWSNREVHSSHEDHFRDDFYIFCLGDQKLTPIQEIVIISETFAPKFCAESPKREVHSSHRTSFVTISVFVLLLHSPLQ